MDIEELVQTIYPELLIEFNNEITSNTLRLNADLLSRILKVIYSNNYVLVVNNTGNVSSNLENSSEMLKDILERWIQVEDNKISYVPADQIIGELAYSNWILTPAEGVVRA